MRALEPVRGLRVIASAAALDAATWDEHVVVLRLAPDDAFGVGAERVEVADDDAIVVPETGFVGAWLRPHEFAEHVRPQIEWTLPEARPALAQGLIAGVPAKLWLEHERTLVLCAAAYSYELADRIS